MSKPEQFLSQRQRYQPIVLPQTFTDEEMVRDWALLVADQEVIVKYHKKFRLHMAIQLCAVRLYGRFLKQVHDLAPQIVGYLSKQLALPPSLDVEVPAREATYLEHRQAILQHLGFQRFGDRVQQQLETWLTTQAQVGLLPDDLFHQAEHYLLSRRILLPGPSVLERLIIHVCGTVHQTTFESISEALSPELRQAIDQLLKVSEGEQRSYFHQLKAYPPAATISALQSYLARYQTVAKTGINAFEGQLLTPPFLDYLFKQARRYSAKDLKRFSEHKRYALMACFLLETRKVLLDHLVTMHDQYVMTMCRKSKHTYEQKHRDLRKRHKKAVDVVLEANTRLLDWPAEESLSSDDLWQQVNKEQLQNALTDLRAFKKLEERGYGDLILARYPSLRKYFADFLQLPFAAEHGNNALLQAISLVKQLDAGEMKRIPTAAPTGFVPKDLRRALHDSVGKLNRNAWETGLALAIKDALRSGDLFLPQSKQHVSFWELMLNDTRWHQLRTTAADALEQPASENVKTVLPQQFNEAVAKASTQFPFDDFAEIRDGKLKLKRYDKVDVPPEVSHLQKVINARLPTIRIEQLLIEVDQLTHFSRHFVPVQGHQSKPAHFYRSLMATIISQATNLGIVAMSASVQGTTVDMLRHVLHDFIRCQMSRGLGVSRQSGWRVS